MSIFFIFLFGLFIGSFLNVLIDRLPNSRSILGRSKCDNCHKTLRWNDLIPLFSFVFLKGKCRYCHVPLSYQYPALEIVTGVMFALTYVITLTSAQIIDNLFLVNLFFNLSIVSSFIVIFFADLKYGIIPDEVLIFAGIMTFIWLVIVNQPLFVNHLVAGVGAFLFFLLIFGLTRGRGMGFGDVKLAGLMGLLLGAYGVALAVYIAFLTGALIGIILILWKKKRMKSAVPFGPFLVLGTFLSFFFSPIILPKITALLW